MADNTKIEWADATVNAINGCSLASPGCTNCYAMKLAGTRMKHHPTREGLTQESKAGPVWTGEVRLHEPALLQPLKWQRPRQIFWNAHGDTFHDAVPDEWIDRIFAVAALTPQHTHMILTKRSARMRAYCEGSAAWMRVERLLEELKPSSLWNGNVYRAALILRAGHPLENVWLGVSVEDQTRADERIPDLLATPAAVRFLSCEPLLGPVDLAQLQDNLPPNAWLTWLDSLDWVIVGGESGPNARPMHPDWARSLRDQCADAGVPFHFKQWGEWRPFLSLGNTGTFIDASGEYSGEKLHHFNDGQESARLGKKTAGRLLDGVEHNGLPEVRRG